MTYSTYAQSEVLLDGPRFFVSRGTFSGKPAILKRVLSDQDTWSNRALSKDSLFLRDIHHSPSALKEFLPRLYVFGEEEGKMWQCRELVGGDSLAVAGSTFLVNMEMLESQLIGQLISFLALLHQVSRYFSSDLIALFSKPPVLRNHIRGVLLDRETDSRFAPAQEFLAEEEGFFDTQPKVSAHFEFFAQHLFWDGKQLKVIDWENIGWGDPLFDFTALWMRMWRGPAKQERFWEIFQRSFPDGDSFGRLFQVDKVVQAYGNWRFFGQLEEQGTDLELREEALKFFEGILVAGL